MEQVRIARSRVLAASWFDYPQYYDIAFQAYTQHEANFIEAACLKYCPLDTRWLLESACGSGRLITELAARGYQVVGFDISQPALSYLRRRLLWRLWSEEFLEARIISERIEHRVESEQRGSEWHARSKQTRVRYRE
jgi:2-polyprenyl-3-methyl-5-hydroxy-6-metoxy-1,4-benzoquinol methylase